MKILALMTVKNEGDIVQYAIESAAQWADYIVVMDNGSTDNTLEIIRSCCRQFSNVLFWGTYEGPFHDWLRSLIFNDYKHLIGPGDWVCRLDADELYIDMPNNFLAGLPKDCELVYSASFQYYFTDKDQYTDLSLPAPQRMKYCVCNHSEERFFKLKTDTFWPVTRGWPFALTKISTQRIRLRHFQYRNAAQMQKRFSIRESINESAVNKNLFLHEHRNNKVFSSSELQYDDGQYRIDERLLPPLPVKNFFSIQAQLLLRRVMNISLIKNVIYPPTNKRLK